MRDGGVVAAGAGALVAVAVVLATLLSSSAVPAASCCAPAVECSGGPPCPVPPPPPPTVVFGSGIGFTVSHGNYDFVAIEPSSASEMTLNGSLTATEGVVIYLVTPDVFARFTASPGTFNCSGEQQEGRWCVPAWVAAGTIYWWPSSDAMPIYNESGVIQPWYLVMQNPNPSTATRVTWPTGLVASYFDVYS